MATNFLSSIVPLNFISRIFALAHFNSELNILSKFWVFYSFLFMTFMSCLSMFQLTSEITDVTNTKLLKFVSFIRITSPTVTRASISIVFIIKYKRILHFIDCISDVEKVIQKALHIPLSKQLYVRFQMIVIFFIIFAVLIHGFLTFTISGPVSAILSTFVVISYIAQAQFISCVLLLNQYIKVITTKIDQLSQTNYSCVPLSTQNNFEVHFKSYNDISHGRNYFAEDNKQEQIIGISRELIRFISIIKDDLSSYFSFPILLVIADNLLITTFNLYMLIKTMTTSEELLTKLSYLYTVSLNVIQVIFIAFPCAGANKEVSGKAKIYIVFQTTHLKRLLAKKITTEP